jgi:hypothetical protein
MTLVVTDAIEATLKSFVYQHDIWSISREMSVSYGTLYFVSVLNTIQQMQYRKIE